MPLRARALEALPAISCRELPESRSPAGMYVGSVGKLLLGDRIHRQHMAEGSNALGSYWEAETDKKPTKKEGQ